MRPSGSGERTPVVIAARRTPVTTIGRGLAGVDAAALAAPVLTGLAEDAARLGIDGQVDEVILGNCRGPGGNLARVAALAAGLGVQVPGVTVDRQCGSGQAAIQLAADQIASGSSDLVFAGGVESASTQPETRLAGHPYTRARFAPAPFEDPDMGAAAQLLADAAGITREQQDAYALRSHRLALASIASGVEDAELVSVPGAHPDVRQDDRPRRLRPEVLARFPSSFAGAGSGAEGSSGSVTAGNSCGVSDGAAAVVVVPEAVRARLGVPGLALRDWCTAGVDPACPGIGPVPAIQTLLGRARLDWADVTRLEIIEAFAGQVLACTRAWGLDPLGADHGLVCVQGGAIARGHPWGASGALLLVRLFSQLVRLQPGQRGGDDPRRYALATSAIGGGQGVALLVERVG